MKNYLHSLGNGHSFPTGMSRCPESEGLLNGQASFDRNLHICSEQDSLLVRDSNSPTQNAVKTMEEGLEEISGDDADSDNEINIVSHKPGDDVALSLNTERSVLPLHSL